MGNLPKYEVIDDFLDKESFDKIKHEMLNNASPFPWFYKDRVVSDNLDDKFSVQFVHVLYEFNAPGSPYYNLIVPLLEKIDPLAIIRIKANLTTATSEPVEYGWHKDFAEGQSAYDNYGRSAVFYINDTNGPTVLEIDGERIEVESKANRFVSFDPSLLHTGISATDAKARVLINLNYIVK